MNQNKKIATDARRDELNDDIPPLSDELESEILLRLPTKPLFRCNCVCKRWNSLISDSSFVKKRKSLPPLITGFFSGDNQCNDQIEPKVNFFEIDPNDTQMDRSLSFIDRCVVPVASHNGLLLCAERPDLGMFSILHPFQYILCNPYTKQWVMLPKPNRDHTIRNVILHSYSTQAFHFKVICFMTEYRNNALDLLIYSSEIGEWKESTIFHRLGRLHPSYPSILLDGSFYFWSAPIWHFEVNHLCVCNLEEESVGSVDVPIVPSGHSGFTLLGLSAGCLHYSECSETHFRVWVLIDGKEWSLRHSVRFESLTDYLQWSLDSVDHLQPNLPFEPMFYALAFHPLNDQIVLVEMMHTRKVALYYMDEERFVIHDNIDRSFFPVVPYFSPAWPPFI